MKKRKYESEERRKERTKRVKGVEEKREEGKRSMREGKRKFVLDAVDFFLTHFYL